MDKEFIPIYNEWRTSYSDLHEFLWERFFKIEDQDKEKPIPLVTDTFVRCEMCNNWKRLDPVDETNMRTIPLMRSHYEGKKWLCDTCWDKAEEKGWMEEE